MNLDDYEVVDIINIETKQELTRCYDITVDEDSSFCISIGNEEIITHNCDGQHIIGLLILLFKKFWPELLTSGKIKILRTPSVIATYKGKKYNFITEQEYDEWIVDKKGYTTKYCKGLGGHDSKTFRSFLDDVNSYVTIDYDPKRDDESLGKAFDPKRADDRKDWVAIV